jgi:hypothetical protein
MSKTITEIESLKNNWLKNPCWDIEDTEGFESYKEELLAFRLHKEKEWEENRTKKHEQFRKDLYNLDLHSLIYDPCIKATIIRVPGGWIYNFSLQSMSESGPKDYQQSVFVPFNNDMQKEMIL